MEKTSDPDRGECAPRFAGITVLIQGVQHYSQCRF